MYAKLPEGRKNLFQWDVGQYLEVSADVHRVDFLYRENSDIVYGVYAKDQKVSIPDVLLHRHGVMDALVMAVRYDGTATYLREEIPVFERPIPPGYVSVGNGNVVSYEDLENVLGEMNFLSKDGGTMEGDIDMSGRAIRGLVDPVNDDEATRKSFTEFTYLHKNGGQVTGRFTGFQEPVGESEPATKKYVDDQNKVVSDSVSELSETVAGMRKTFSASIGTEWVGEDAPYTQEVSVEGILEADMPHIIPVYDQDAETAAAQAESWNAVSFGTAKAGGILFTCLEDKPEVEIPIQIEVIR